MNKADKIRKATLAAVAQRDAYVNRSTEDVAELYRKAAEQLTDQIRGDDSRRVELNELHNLLDAMRAVLQRLSKQRNHALDNDLQTLAVMAGMPFGNVLDSRIRLQKADEAVDFVRRFVYSDGLQLSDRLWRLDRQAAETLGNHLKAAVGNGEDAFRAVMHSMSNGDDVPPYIAKAYDAARAGVLRQSVRDILTGTPDPRTGKGVLYQAERLFRTELIRAHGEAYMGMAFETDGIAGVRFMLSPRHPKPDICDQHASADLYGLGAGVYPNRESCPWPAHPNTFSYVVAVFEEEVAGKIGEKDKVVDMTLTDTTQFEEAYRNLYDKINHLQAQGISATDDLKKELVIGHKWVAARLDSQQQTWLNTVSEVVLLSDDTLVKQIAHHGSQPVFLEHYQNLQKLIDDARVIVRSNESSVMFFNLEDKVMKAVLKTTRDGSEVYLSSLHVSDMSSVRRALKKGKTVFKNGYSFSDK